jgi:hypothetical protein
MHAGKCEIAIRDSRPWLLEVSTWVVCYGLLLSFGTIVVHLFGNQFDPCVLELGDAFYFTVVTATTLGYGDISPSGEVAKWRTIALVLGGIANFGFFLNAVAHQWERQRAVRNQEAAVRDIRYRHVRFRVELAKICIEAAWVELSERELRQALVEAEAHDFFSAWAGSRDSFSWESVRRGLSERQLCQTRLRSLCRRYRREIEARLSLTHLANPHALRQIEGVLVTIRGLENTAFDASQGLASELHMAALERLLTGWPDYGDLQRKAVDNLLNPTFGA